MSGFVPVIFVVLAIALAVGPVMMIRPSKGQQMIANLRSRAAQQGLIVHTDTKSEGMNYFLPWHSSSEFDGQWCLRKQKFVHGAHFHQDWDFDKPEFEFDEQQTLAMKKLLDDLEDVVALGANRVGVYIGWNERRHGRTVDVCIEQLKVTLTQLKDVFTGGEACGGSESSGL